ncbi:MAG: hypothetical protein GVY27_06085 [Deinococcus-Thermus bacterium]|jgi:uncharacterized protein involved in cysteine biosynthesis|nr:hypothetical protein [Deinococcota bacterium]
MIFTAFGRALAQAFDRRFLRVLLLGLGLTVALLFAVYGAFLWGLDWLLPDTVTLPGGREIAWVDDLLSVGSILLMLVLSVFLMVPVASAFTGLFLEDVAAAVEKRHYPHLPPVPRLPWGDAIRDSVNFFGVLVAVNLVALALYFVVGPFAPLLFWVVNGYLLGREYFQLVAMRRLGRAGAVAARKRNAGRIWLAGTLMAAPLSIPVVNLVIPILGAATFTHLFIAWERPAQG